MTDYMPFEKLGGDKNINQSGGCVVFGTRFLSAILASACLVIASPVNAALLTFEFSGTVDTVDSSLTGTFSVNQAISGSYTVDTSVPGTPAAFFSFDPAATPTSMYYPALIDLKLTIGGYVTSMVPGVSTNGVGVFQNVNLLSLSGLSSGPYDMYNVSSSISPAGVAGALNANFSLALLSSPGAVISSLDLPVEAAQLSAFPDKQFQLSFATSDPAGPFQSPTFLGVTGTISSISASPVPIPAALVLFGSGLAGLLSFCRRKR